MSGKLFYSYIKSLYWKNDVHVYLSYNGQTGINELPNFLKAPSKAV